MARLSVNSVEEQNRWWGNHKIVLKKKKSESEPDFKERRKVRCSRVLQVSRDISKDTDTKTALRSSWAVWNKKVHGGPSIFCGAREIAQSAGRLPCTPASPGLIPNIPYGPSVEPPPSTLLHHQEQFLTTDRCGPKVKTKHTHKKNQCLLCMLKAQVRFLAWHSFRNTSRGNAQPLRVNHK